MEQVERNSMDWYVIYTKPRWEKKVRDLLKKNDIEVYCPLITEIRQWSDRKKKITTPLFKSHLFVRLPENRRNEVFNVPGVIRYLYWLGKPAIVRPQEIEIIEKWLNDETIVFTEIGHLTPGDNLTIVSGSFKGRKAEVSEIGRSRLKLILKDMGLIVNIKLSEVIEN